MKHDPVKTSVDILEIKKEALLPIFNALLALPEVCLRLLAHNNNQILRFLKSTCDPA